MKLLLRLLPSLFFWGGGVGIMLGLIGCSSINYYTYKEVDPPAHISHPVIIPIVIDSKFSSGEALAIKQAAREWNIVLNGQIKLEFGEHLADGVDKKQHLYPDTFNSFADGQKLQGSYENTNLGWVIYHLDSNDSNLGSFGDISSGTLAFVKGIDEHYVVVAADRMVGRSLKDVMMHEMAHLLGAEHIKIGSLEYPYYSAKQSDCIDKITVAQVAEVRKLDMKTLSYCLLPGWE